MSDDSKETRPKLKLTRDTLPQEPEAATEAKPAAPKAPSADLPPTEPPIAPKPKLQMPTSDDSSKAPVPPPPPVQAEATETTPPALPPKPEQEAAPEAPATEKKAKADSPMLSIAIISALFIILVVIAIGIWLVLRPAGSEAEPIAESSAKIQSPAPEASDPVTEPRATMTSQIARTKETIANVPVMEALPSMSDPLPAVEATQPSQDAPSPVIHMKSTPVAVPQETSHTAQINAQQRAALQSAAAQYLAQIHIDGLRSGSKPKVMINAESYTIGEIVNEETGLSFEGIKDGKILFKDRNGFFYLKSF